MLSALPEIPLAPLAHCGISGDALSYLRARSLNAWGLGGGELFFYARFRGLARGVAPRGRRPLGSPARGDDPLWTPLLLPRFWGGV